LYNPRINGVDRPIAVQVVLAEIFRRKEELEPDGAVDGSTKNVQYTYGTDYSSGNYDRLNYVTYPSSRKIWMGYTHTDTANTFQDTINDTFSRVGQIARDNSGSIGDLLAEYDFGGMGRFFRRVHDEASGAYGNDTRADLWHGTSGTYAGLDRFGRIIDMKHTDYSGTPADLLRLKYTYDRNSNRLSIEDSVHAAESQSFTYDTLDRLTIAKRGILDGNDAVQLSSAQETLNMDLLGNFTSGAGGIAINGATAITHAVNETNEITTLDRPNPAGAEEVIDEEFASTLSSFWVQDTGTWSVSGGEVNVDTLSGGEAILLANARLDLLNYSFSVKFPASSSTNKAGLIVGHDGANSYYAVVLDRNASKLAVHKVTSGSWGGAIDSTAATINDSTEYTILVERKQRQIKARLVGQTVSIDSGSLSDLEAGETGFFSDKTNVTFGHFTAYNAATRAALTPRIGP
jgi:hypothetical protein